MNRYTESYATALLAVAAIVLTGMLALANELPGASPPDTNIVVAKATLPRKPDCDPGSLQDDQEAAVSEAIEGLMEDNKLQLELRLSGHKSVILAAD